MLCVYVYLYVHTCAVCVCMCVCGEYIDIAFIEYTWEHVERIHPSAFVDRVSRGLSDSPCGSVVAWTHEYHTKRKRFSFIMISVSSRNLFYKLNPI